MNTAAFGIIIVTLRASVKR